MNTSELENAWVHHKEHFENQLISEGDILFVIHQDIDGHAKLRPFLYNWTLFLFLFTFCQTC